MKGRPGTLEEGSWNTTKNIYCNLSPILPQRDLQFHQGNGAQGEGNYQTYQGPLDTGSESILMPGH